MSEIEELKHLRARCERHLESALKELLDSRGMCTLGHYVNSGYTDNNVYADMINTVFCGWAVAIAAINYVLHPNQDNKSCAITDMVNAARVHKPSNASRDILPTEVMRRRIEQLEGKLDAAFTENMRLQGMLSDLEQSALPDDVYALERRHGKFRLELEDGMIGEGVTVREAIANAKRMQWKQKSQA